MLMARGRGTRERWGDLIPSSSFRGSTSDVEIEMFQQPTTAFISEY